MDNKIQMRPRRPTRPYTPPRWTIDLSLPPKDRYRELARHYKDAVQDLTGLYDSLLRDVALPEVWIPRVNRLSRLLLRRLYDKTHTEELRGISEESDIPMYLLVAFNVILDLLMGCTSGGVRTLEEGRPFNEAKMLHFRTLDWSMDPLRQIVVQLEFVRSRSSNPEHVLATSITYVGFIGVLTGVRSGLSMSLNFRGLHDNSTKIAQFRFYLHHLLVLLGRRPSIAMYLRRYLIGDHERIEAPRRPGRHSHNRGDRQASGPPTARLADIYADLQYYHTTAAYLIFSDGDSTMSIDKDFRSSKMRRSSDFIATTNHDVLEHEGDQRENVLAAKAVQHAARHTTGLDEFLDESEDRLKCLNDRWKRLTARKQRERARDGETISNKDIAAQTSATHKQINNWLSSYPTRNETTHYSCLMSPKDNSVVMCLAYPLPVDDQDRLELDL